MGNAGGVRNLFFAAGLRADIGRPQLQSGGYRHLVSARAQLDIDCLSHRAALPSKGTAAPGGWFRPRDVGSLGGSSVTLRDAQAGWFEGVRRPRG